VTIRNLYKASETVPFFSSVLSLVTFQFNDKCCSDIHVSTLSQMNCEGLQKTIKTTGHQKF